MYRALLFDGSGPGRVSQQIARRGMMEIGKQPRLAAASRHGVQDQSGRQAQGAGNHDARRQNGGR